MAEYFAKSKSSLYDVLLDATTNEPEWDDCSSAAGSVARDGTEVDNMW